MMNIYLANPRGFCAGVDRAIEIVNRALETFGAPPIKMKIFTSPLRTKIDSPIFLGGGCHVAIICF